MSGKWRCACCWSVQRGWSSTWSCPVLFLPWWVLKAPQGISLMVTGTIQVWKGEKKGKRNETALLLAVPPFRDGSCHFPGSLLYFPECKWVFLLGLRQSDLGNSHCLQNGGAPRHFINKKPIHLLEMILQLPRLWPLRDGDSRPISAVSEEKRRWAEQGAAQPLTRSVFCVRQQKKEYKS